jgi:coenzyme PQQ precursor peptide PqqA
MVAALCGGGGGREDASRGKQSWSHAAPQGATAFQPVSREGDFQMTWQTPQAVDIRFGFEITMYAAAR